MICLLNAHSPLPKQINWRGLSLHDEFFAKTFCLGKGEAGQLAQNIQPNLVPRSSGYFLFICTFSRDELNLV